MKSFISRGWFAVLPLAGGLLTACGEDLVVSPLDPVTVSMQSVVEQSNRGSLPDVCSNVDVPAGSKLDLRVYANGVQIYRWNGVSWTFVAPSAVLTAERDGSGVIGSHYAGPTWESVSGSKVVGAVRERCTPDPSAVAWLLLDATPAGGPGIFRRAAFIQRINTVGGIAPATAGSFVNEEARVPYTTEYLFFRSE